MCCEDAQMPNCNSLLMPNAYRERNGQNFVYFLCKTSFPFFNLRRSHVHCNTEKCTWTITITIIIPTWTYGQWRRSWTWPPSTQKIMDSTTLPCPESVGESPKFSCIKAEGSQRIACLQITWGCTLDVASSTTNTTHAKPELSSTVSYQLPIHVLFLNGDYWNYGKLIIIERILMFM